MSYVRNVGDMTVFVNCICNPEATYAEYYDDIDSLMVNLSKNGISKVINNSCNLNNYISHPGAKVPATFKLSHTWPNSSNISQPSSVLVRPSISI